MVTPREGSAAGAVLGAAPFTVTAVGSGNGLVLPPFGPLLPPPPFVEPPLPPFVLDWLLSPFGLARGMDRVPDRFNAIPRCAIEGPTTARVAESVTFRSASSDRSGAVSDETWYVYGPIASDRIGERGSETVEFTPKIAGTYSVDLHLTDDQGAVNSCSVRVQVGA